MCADLGGTYSFLILGVAWTCARRTSSLLLPPPLQSAQLLVSTGREDSPPVAMVSCLHSGFPPEFISGVRSCLLLPGVRGPGMLVNERKMGRREL